MGTNALEIKREVFNRVKALALPDVSVTWGFTKSPERRWIMLGKIEWEKSEWATNRSREESFSLECYINVQMTSGTPEEVEAQAIDYGKAIEEMIKADPKMGFGNVVTSGFRPGNLTSFPADQVYEAVYECEITVTARL